MENHVKLIGVTTGVLKINHHITGNNGEILTALETEIVYTSANQVSNTIKIIVWENSLYEKALTKKNNFVEIEGALNTFNKNAWGKRITEVFVSPQSVKVLKLPPKRQVNKIELTGTICGKINLKRRSKGNPVAEAKLKVTKQNSSDYIPIVAFGDDALRLNNVKQGQEISVSGRIHSRTFMFNYQEKGQEKEVERTALEVGIHVLNIKEKEKKKENERFLDDSLFMKHSANAIFSGLIDVHHKTPISFASKKREYERLTIGQHLKYLGDTPIKMRK